MKSSKTANEIKIMIHCQMKVSNKSAKARPVPKVFPFCYKAVIAKITTIFIYLHKQEDHGWKFYNAVD